MSKKEPRWARFTEYIAEKNFSRDQLGIKTFKKIFHPEHIMVLLNDTDMEKKIITCLKNERAKIR